MAEHGLNAIGAVLTCHPESSPGGVSQIEAHIERRSNDALAVGFSLNGAISNICIPPAGGMRRADNLWQQTCFEIFLSLPQVFWYYEFNFSPSGEWAVYRFLFYRERAVLETDDRILLSTGSR